MSPRKTNAMLLATLAGSGLILTLQGNGAQTLTPGSPADHPCASHITSTADVAYDAAVQGYAITGWKVSSVEPACDQRRVKILTTTSHGERSVTHGTLSPVPTVLDADRTLAAHDVVSVQTVISG